MLVQGLFVGLTGREWLIKTSGFVWLVFFMVIGPIFESIAASRPAWAWLWDNWPIFPAILVVLKMTAAIVLATRLSRSGLIGDRALVTGAATWAAIVFGCTWFLCGGQTRDEPRYRFLNRDPRGRRQDLRAPLALDGTHRDP